ncbi:MAG: CDP-alcohol phosphatidyltransferase family protein [Desulfobulbaceae bacterium]|nr:CDP-alcohol phosphatidyltransferase family protein [Desulfobulbaceae bacterium]
MNYKLLIPNLLSSLRLFLAIIFPFVPENWWIWLILGAGFSDFLDGQLARRWQVQTWQGGLLDAVADKMFVLSALLSFVLVGRFAPWWLPLVLARDLTVGGIAGYAAIAHDWEAFHKMDARWSGKIATTAQFFLFIIVTLVPAGIHSMVSVTGACSVIAAVDYWLLFHQELTTRKIIPK